MDFHQFVQACRGLWDELIDGRSLHFYLVEGAPGGLPSTRAHVIVVQGEHDRQNAVLFQGEAFPPLYAQGAVLFDSGITTSAFFRVAQYSLVCTRGSYASFVRYQAEGATQWIMDDEPLAVPIATYIEGDVRRIDDPDDEPEGSEGSTDTPGSDDELDEASLFSMD